MKAILKDVLFGVLVVLAVLVLEFLVTLPFDEVATQTDRAGWAFLVNRELLLASLPCALVTFLFTWLLKTQRRSDALRKAVIWTCILAIFYLLIGLGNENLDIIFGSIGLYALLACAFLGPVIYALIRRLN